jgi:L-seryl-tRNA(Ser) seleniumtransferase
MIGMVAAVERYMKVDHAAEWKAWAAQIEYMRSELEKVRGVETGYVPREITNHVPRLWVKWDEKAFNFSREECFQALQEGEPSIVPLRTPMGVTIVPWMMAPGQEKIVAQRLREVLERARKTAQARAPRSDEELARGFAMDNPIDEWNPDGDGLLERRNKIL